LVVSYHRLLETELEGGGGSEGGGAEVEGRFRRKWSGGEGQKGGEREQLLHVVAEFCSI
jgi:hypothetical protein